MTDDSLRVLTEALRDLLGALERYDDGHAASAWGVLQLQKKAAHEVLALVSRSPEPRLEPSALREAAEMVLDGFDNGVFVRDTSNDALAGWSLRLLPYIRALAALKTALAGASSGPTLQEDYEAALREIAQLEQNVRDARARIAELEGRLSATSGEPAPEGLTAIQELAQAAQDYLSAQAHVGVSEDDMRRLHRRLGSLAGPHLVAHTARVARTGTEGTDK